MKEALLFLLCLGMLSASFSCSPTGPDIPKVYRDNITGTYTCSESASSTAAHGMSGSKDNSEVFVRFYCYLYDPDLEEMGTAGPFLSFEWRDMEEISPGYFETNMPMNRVYVHLPEERTDRVLHRSWVYDSRSANPNGTVLSGIGFKQPHEIIKTDARYVFWILK